MRIRDIIIEFRNDDYETLPENISIVERTDIQTEPNIVWNNVGEEKNADEIMHMAEWAYRQLGLQKKLNIKINHHDRGEYDHRYHLVAIPPESKRVGGYDQKFILFHEMAHARQDEQGEKRDYILKDDMDDDPNNPYHAKLQAIELRYRDFITQSEQPGWGRAVCNFSVKEWNGGGPIRYLSSWLASYRSPDIQEVYYEINTGEDLERDLETILSRKPVIDTSKWEQYKLAYMLELPWEADANLTAQRLVREYDKEFGSGFKQSVKE